MKQTRTKSSHPDWKLKLHVGFPIWRKRSLSSRSVWRWTGIPRLSIPRIPSTRQPRVNPHRSVQGSQSRREGLTATGESATCPQETESSEIFINGKSPTLSLRKLPLTQHRLSPFTRVQKKLFDEEVAQTDRNGLVSNRGVDTERVPFAHSTLLRKRFAPKQDIASGQPCDSCIKTRTCRVLLSPSELSRKTEEEHKENFQFLGNPGRKSRIERRNRPGTSSAVDRPLQNATGRHSESLNRTRIVSDMKSGSEVLSERCQSAMGAVFSGGRENGQTSKWAHGKRSNTDRGLPPWRPVIRRGSFGQRTQDAASSRDRPSTSGCSSPPQKRIRTSGTSSEAGEMSTRNHKEGRRLYFDSRKYVGLVSDENDAGSSGMEQRSFNSENRTDGWPSESLPKPPTQEMCQRTGNDPRSRTYDSPYRAQMEKLKQELRTFDRKPRDSPLLEREDSRHGEENADPSRSMPVLKSQHLMVDRHVLRVKRPKLTPAVEAGPKLNTRIEEEGMTNFGTVGGVLASLRNGRGMPQESESDGPLHDDGARFRNQIDRSVFRVTPAVDLGPDDPRTTAVDLMTGTGGVGEGRRDSYESRAPQSSDVGDRKDYRDEGDCVDSGLNREDGPSSVMRFGPLVDYEMDEEETEAGESGQAAGRVEVDAGDSRSDDDDDVILESVTTPRGLKGTQISSLMADLLRSNGTDDKVPSRGQIYVKLQEVFGLKIARWDRFVCREYSRLTANRPEPAAPAQSERTQVTVGRYSLTASDLATLDDNEWLNDNIINAYLHLVSEKAYLEMIAFSSFFYQVYNQKGFEHAHRWHRKSDLFSYHLILIPIHSRHHWCLVVVSVMSATIRYYDSMRHSGMGYLKKVRAYMDQEAAARGRSPIAWTLENCDNVPKQRNDSDCGVFVCQYGKRLGFCKDVAFSHAEAAGFRALMTEELLLRQITPPE